MTEKQINTKSKNIQNNESACSTPSPKEETITQSLLQTVVQKLDDGKATEIKVLDLRGKTSLTDYMVIASGTSSRHVLALIHNLSEELKKEGFRAFGDGLSGDGCWGVLDLGDIIIHVFNPEARSYYNLEELWNSVQ